MQVQPLVLGGDLVLEVVLDRVAIVGAAVQILIFVDLQDADALRRDGHVKAQILQLAEVIADVGQCLLHLVPLRQLALNEHTGIRMVGAGCDDVVLQLGAIVEAAGVHIHLGRHAAVPQVIGELGGAGADAHVGIGDIGVAAGGIQDHDADGVDGARVEGAQLLVHGQELCDVVVAVQAPELGEHRIAVHLVVVDVVLAVGVGELAETVAVLAGALLQSQRALVLQQGDDALKAGGVLRRAILHAQGVGDAIALHDVVVVAGRRVLEGFNDVAVGHLVVDPLLIVIVDGAQPVVVAVGQEVAPVVLRQLVLVDAEGVIAAAVAPQLLTQGGVVEVPQVIENAIDVLVEHIVPIARAAAHLFEQLPAPVLNALHRDDGAGIAALVPLAAEIGHHPRVDRTIVQQGGCGVAAHDAQALGGDAEVDGVVLQLGHEQAKLPYLGGHRLPQGQLLVVIEHTGDGVCLHRIAIAVDDAQVHDPGVRQLLVEDDGAQLRHVGAADRLLRVQNVHQLHEHVVMAAVLQGVQQGLLRHGTAVHDIVYAIIGQAEKRRTGVVGGGAEQQAALLPQPQQLSGIAAGIARGTVRHPDDHGLVIAAQHVVIHLRQVLRHAGKAVAQGGYVLDPLLIAVIDGAQRNIVAVGHEIPAVGLGQAVLVDAVIEEAVAVGPAHQLRFGVGVLQRVGLLLPVPCLQRTGGVAAFAVPVLVIGEVSDLFGGTQQLFAELAGLAEGTVDVYVLLHHLRKGAVTEKCLPQGGQIRVRAAALQLQDVHIGVGCPGACEPRIGAAHGLKVQRVLLPLVGVQQLEKAAALLPAVHALAGLLPAVALRADLSVRSFIGLPQECLEAVGISFGGVFHVLVPLCYIVFPGAPIRST